MKTIINENIFSSLESNGYKFEDNYSYWKVYEKINAAYVYAGILPKEYNDNAETLYAKIKCA